MTTQGYILTSHSGKLIDGQPERYGQYADVAAIVDTYARETGWGIWEAYPDIMAMRHASFIKSSRLAEDLSIMVFREHPLEFTRSVLKAVGRFWDSRIFTGDDISGSRIFSFLRPVYDLLYRVGVFLLLIVFAMDVFRPHQWFRPLVIERMLILGIVIGLCLSSTIPIAVENARYKIPLLPLMWGVVAGSITININLLRSIFAKWH